jgi:A/G-specific adenine glycosylase
VDGNVRRVFSRLFAIRGSGATVERRCWSIAETLVRGPSPGDWNQAVMELGATVCTPRAPRCDRCPLAASCSAAALGTPDAFPTPPKRKATRVVAVAAAWVERRGRVLLVRQHGDGPLRGEWDLPAAIIPEGLTPGRVITRELRARYATRVRTGALLASAKHSILALEGALAGTAPRRADIRWLALDRLGTAAVSGATTKLARAVIAQRRSQERLASSTSSGSRGRAKA